MDAQLMRRAGNDSSPAGGHRPAILWGNPCVWEGSGWKGSARGAYREFYGVFGVVVEVNTNQLVNTIGRDSREAMLGWEEASGRLTPGVGTGESPAGTAGLPPVGTFLLRVGVSTLWRGRGA